MNDEFCYDCGDTRACQRCRGGGEDPDAATPAVQPCPLCGGSWRVIVDGQFCGCSEDEALAGRHLRNVLARLEGREPESVTMTVEQFHHDRARSEGRVVLFDGRRILAMAPSRQQGWFFLAAADGARQSARYCDLVEVEP